MQLWCIPLPVPFYSLPCSKTCALTLAVLFSVCPLGGASGPSPTSRPWWATVAWATTTAKTGALRSWEAALLRSGTKTMKPIWPFATPRAGSRWVALITLIEHLLNTHSFTWISCLIIKITYNWIWEQSDQKLQSVHAPITRASKH